MGGEIEAKGRAGVAWESPDCRIGSSQECGVLQAARANLEKAQSELSGAADEAARAEIQIRIEANEALVKALE